MTLGAPHGVRGAVRVVVHAEDPFALKRYNPMRTGDGRELRLKTMREIGRHLVAEFDGLNDRDAALAFRGADLWVPRQRLPRLDEDEFYYVDLIGLDARGTDGASLGSVRAVDDYGAGPLLLVEGQGLSGFVPFTRAAVPALNLAEGWLTVSREFLEDGATSDPPDSPAQAADGDER